jgi:hypothetical protein
MSLEGTLEQHSRWLQHAWNSTETADIPDDRRWWEFWRVDKSRKRDLSVIGRYLLEGLDDFIKLANQQGRVLDHKTPILAAIGTLYDTIIVDAKIPFWLKPFRGSLKTIVINVLASLLIDFIVEHYEGGSFAG